MIQNVNLLVFAVAFMGCVLATPVVTRFACWAGAIDRPDQFRRVHLGAIPRLGGLALAAGLVLAVLPVLVWTSTPSWEMVEAWWLENWSISVAGLIVLLLGALDDTHGLQPRVKLAGQAAAAMVLISGGVRITQVAILGFPISLSFPVTLPLGASSIVVDPLSIILTLVWFLACMNIWNLIDGMDGLASGVALLVSGTLMLVALKQGNMGAAALAAALAGGLAGFLLYNWHPACIFLGDSGSLLIGLLIGVIGVRASMRGTATVSILFPILAMGLPISDTAMAIFRRWVRNLPLSSADRRHIHHLLIGLGLNPRQAAVILYCLTGFLCGVVLLGVALNNPLHGELLALVLGVSGCLAFLVILTSRRDELASLTRDLKVRFARKRQERDCARLTWEAIQKVELCPSARAIWEILRGTAQALGCAAVQMSCDRGEQVILNETSRDDWGMEAVTGSTATFRLRGGEDLRLEVTFHQVESPAVEADIAFRSLQRLSLAIAERLDRHYTDADRDGEPPRTRVVPQVEPDSRTPSSKIAAREVAVGLVAARQHREIVRWLRWAVSLGGLGFESRG